MHLLLILHYCIDTSRFISTENGYSYIGGIINIIGCFFTRFNTFESSGGIFFTKDIDLQLTFSESTFYNCSSLGIGGAFFIDCPHNNCEVFFYKIFSNKCFVSETSHWNFGGVITKSGADLMTSFQYLSFSECSPYYGNGKRSLRFNNGHQICKFVNCTNNKVEFDSGISFFTFKSELSYSNFLNNTSSSHSCLFFYWIESNFDMDSNVYYINFINNISPTESSFYLDFPKGFIYIKNSTFDKNIGKLFFNYQYDISISSIIENCYINHDINLIGTFLPTVNYIETIELLLYNQFYPNCYFSIKKSKDSSLFYPIFVSLISMLLYY